MQKTPATLLPMRSFNSKRVDVEKGQRADCWPIRGLMSKGQMQADSRLLLKLLKVWKLRMGQSVADVFCMSGLHGEPNQMWNYIIAHW